LKSRSKHRSAAMNQTTLRSSAIFVVFALLICNIAGLLPKLQRVSGAKVETARCAKPAPAPARLSEEQAREGYGHLGVSFEENRGQTDARVKFLARQGGQT